MHEASLAQGLLNLITDSVCQYNAAHTEKPAGRVTALRLGLGPLSCVETETFKGCFELLSEGSVAEGAKLDMEIIPVSCTCVSCGEHFLLRKKMFRCPQCGSDQLFFTGGHGLTLLSLEVENKDEENA